MLSETDTVWKSIQFQPSNGEKKNSVKEGNDSSKHFSPEEFFSPTKKIGVYYQRRQIHLYHISVPPEFNFSTAAFNHFAWLAVPSDRENLKPF